MDVDFPLFLFTTTAAMLSSFMQPSLKFILNIVYSESNQSVALRDEIAELKKEMSKVSMLDEFARHARLQRKVNQLQGLLNNERKSTISARRKYNFLINICFSIIMALTMILFLYMFRRRPVFILPTEWLSPLSAFMAWPSEEVGAVSVFCWSAICNGVSRVLSKRFCS